MARESAPVPSILETSPREEFHSTVIPSIQVTSPLEEFQSTVIPSILVNSPLEEFQSTVIPSILVTTPLEEFHSTVIPSILLSRELYPEDEEEDTSSNHFRYCFLGESTRETKRSSIVVPLYKECRCCRITYNTKDQSLNF